MKKKDSLPDSHKKRGLLFDKKTSPERQIFYGEMFLLDGRLPEAAELFAKASHREGLDQLAKLAIEQGDSFLYSVVTRGSEDGDSPEAWMALGKKAMEFEKYSHAVRAFRLAGDEEALKAAEEALKEVLARDKA
jgi:tetratricopeptide (TPR) repeat protein